jgi:hypothetical protein
MLVEAILINENCIYGEIKSKYIGVMFATIQFRIICPLFYTGMNIVGRTVVELVWK